MKIESNDVFDVLTRCDLLSETMTMIVKIGAFRLVDFLGKEIKKKNIIYIIPQNLIMYSAYSKFYTAHRRGLQRSEYVNVTKIAFSGQEQAGHRTFALVCDEKTHQRSKRT